MKKFLLALSAIVLCALSLHATLFPVFDLNNYPIGGPWNFQVGIRFRAPVSAPLTAVRIYEITQGTYYAGGDGGRIKYELRSDASGFPGALIAGGVMLDDPQYTEWLNAGGFPLIGFPTTPILTAGTWYHFVMTNVAADPINNFISWDGMLAQGGTNLDPNSSVEYKAGTDPWRVDTRMEAAPVAYFTADGYKWGNGGYQVATRNSVPMCGTAYGFVC